MIDSPTGFVHPARLLATFGGRARKRFGQNFLASPAVVESIVAAAIDGPQARVFEIGPGLGVLTGALLHAGAEVTAFEIDRDLVPFLTERFADSALTLHEVDATTVDWNTALQGDGWVCAANLPYNVGTGLLVELLKWPVKVSRLVVMLQEEVAMRVLAPAGDRARGSLSVYCQARAKVSRVVRVPPGAFHPPPKVKSAVIRLDPLPNVDSVALRSMERVVRMAFAAPRKMVRSGLSAGFPRDAVERALVEAGVSETARPGDLTVEQWSTVTKYLSLRKSSVEREGLECASLAPE